ncbi:MAG: hypothetical protein WA446_05960 [Steroidobacteraceae bacterium]
MGHARAFRGRYGVLIVGAYGHALRLDPDRDRTEDAAALDVRATLVFIVILVIGVALAYSTYGLSASWGEQLAHHCCLVVSIAIKVADQWNRAIVLRLGRCHALRGPGLFLIVPIIDTIPLLDRHPGDHLGIQRRTHAHQ